MVDAQIRAAGRTARGVVASAALVTAALSALMALAWSCCSTPTFGERFGGFLGIVPLAVVATVALPPVTRRVQTSGLRWWLAPLVVADLGALGWMSWTSVPAELGDEVARGVMVMLIPLLVPNLICAIYVAWRVVLHPPSIESEPSPGAPSSTPS